MMQGRFIALEAGVISPEGSLISPGTSTDRPYYQSRDSLASHLRRFSDVG